METTIDKREVLLSGFDDVIPTWYHHSVRISGAIIMCEGHFYTAMSNCFWSKEGPMVDSTGMILEPVV